ncbi:MAG: protein translocase subunit SecD [Actinomycetota bacterium]|nr:protein translocase subunit SecD [Actinomycetota bacterium]
MRNKKVHISIIIIFIILIGLSFCYIFKDSAAESIKLGLDLKGGTQIILKPTASEGSEVTSERLNDTIDKIRKRIDRLGVSEPLVTKDQLNNIVVQLPGVKDPDTAREVIGKTAQLEFRMVEGTFISSCNGAWNIVGIDYDDGKLVFDPEAEETILIDDINKFFNGESAYVAGELVTDPETGEMILIEMDGQDTLEESGEERQEEKDGSDKSDINPEDIIGTVEYDPETMEMFLVKGGEQIGEILLDSRTGAATLVGPVLITGEKLANAVAGYDNYGNIRVALSFKDEGVEKFAEITTGNIGRNLAIVLDEEIESAPYIEVPITDGEAEITGIDSVEEAKNIEIVLQTGALPINLHIEDSSTVGPTLGMDSLKKGLYAGIAGFVLIIIFMFFYYRGLGIYSALGLIIYIVLFWGVISAIGAALTLPGIAGIILTIGMAVDANVIIFERIKEELLKDKSPRIAISEGYKNAIRTIVDSNVTTLITAGALYQFGTGPIKGFAVTLSLGVVISMVISLLFTRSGIFLTAGIPRMATPVFLGVRRKNSE